MTDAGKPDAGGDRTGPDPDMRLDWDKMGGLLPVVVQDADTLQVLTLA